MKATVLFFLAFLVFSPGYGQASSEKMSYWWNDIPSFTEIDWAVSQQWTLNRHPGEVLEVRIDVPGTVRLVLCYSMINDSIVRQCVAESSAEKEYLPSYYQLQENGWKEVYPAKTGFSPLDQTGLRDSADCLVKDYDELRKGWRTHKREVMVLNPQRTAIVERWKYTVGTDSVKYWQYRSLPSGCNELMTWEIVGSDSINSYSDFTCDYPVCLLRTDTVNLSQFRLAFSGNKSRELKEHLVAVTGRQKFNYPIVDIAGNTYEWETRYTYTTDDSGLITLLTGKQKQYKDVQVSFTWKRQACSCTTKWKPKKNYTVTDIHLR